MPTPTEEHTDGRRLIDGLPFAECNRCGNVIVLDDEGLAGHHNVACGRPCELSPYGEHESPCDGWCDACRTIITGCKGDPHAPCGTPQCEECGVHAHDNDGIVCRNPRRGVSVVCAWTWDRVTCGRCKRVHAHRALRAESVEGACA